MFDEEKDESTETTGSEEETTSSEETSQQETVGKQRVKVSDEDKHIADKDEVICPLVLKVTNGRQAVNYDITWLSTTQLGGQEGVGCWRSSPQSRGHTEAFVAEFNKMKEEGKIPKDWGGFYFTHEQGIAARIKYQNLVLRGRVKANKKSWENRFSQSRFTGVSYEDLMSGNHLMEEDDKVVFRTKEDVVLEFDEFDNLEQAQAYFKGFYSASTPKKAKEIIESERPTLDETALHATDDMLDEIEPDDSEILSMASEQEPEAEEEAEDLEAEESFEVEVAATTVAESDIAGLDILRPEEELDEVEVDLGPFDEFQELTADAFEIKDAGGMKRLYLFQAPHNEELYCLTAGRHIIDGCLYNIRVEDEEESS